MPGWCITEDVKPQSEDPEFLSTAQVAARLSVPPSTVRDWARRGVGPPAYKFGRHRRYGESELDAWIETRREGAS